MYRLKKNPQKGEMIFCFSSFDIKGMKRTGNGSDQYQPKLYQHKLFTLSFFPLYQRIFRLDLIRMENDKLTLRAGVQAVTLSRAKNLVNLEGRPGTRN